MGQKSITSLKISPNGVARNWLSRAAFIFAGVTRVLTVRRDAIGTTEIAETGALAASLSV
jgi:hypothetical protein